MILDRVAALAKLIHDDYKGRRPVLLCVLKGANPVRAMSRGSFNTENYHLLIFVDDASTLAAVVLSKFAGGANGGATGVLHGVLESVFL